MESEEIQNEKILAHSRTRTHNLEIRSQTLYFRRRCWLLRPRPNRRLNVKCSGKCYSLGTSVFQYSFLHFNFLYHTNKTPLQQKLTAVAHSVTVAPLVYPYKYLRLLMGYLLHHGYGLYCNTWSFWQPFSMLSFCDPNSSRSLDLNSLCLRKVRGHFSPFAC